MLKETLIGNSIALKHLSSLLHIVEESVPVSMIAMKESEEPESGHLPFDGDDSGVRSIFEDLVNAKKQLGNSVESIKAFMSMLEPFNRFPHLIALIQ